MEVRVLEFFYFPKFTLSGENNRGIYFLDIETLVKNLCVHLFATILVLPEKVIVFFILCCPFWSPESLAL